VPGPPILARSASAFFANLEFVIVELLYQAARYGAAVLQADCLLRPKREMQNTSCDTRQIAQQPKSKKDLRPSETRLAFIQKTQKAILAIAGEKILSLDAPIIENWTRVHNQSLAPTTGREYGGVFGE